MGETAISGRESFPAYLTSHLANPCWTDLLVYGIGISSQSTLPSGASPQSVYASETSPDNGKAAKNSSVSGNNAANNNKFAAGKSSARDASTGNSEGNSQTAASAADSAAGGQTAGVTNFQTYTPIATNSLYYFDCGKIAETTTYPYQKVDSSYFSDAVFIGDSRTLGLHDYSGWEDADFYCDNGFSVYKWCKDGQAIDQRTGGTIDLKSALSQKHYTKVYLMIGMNDLGYGTTDFYQQNMQKMIDMIKEIEPDAIIYLMANLHMAEAKNDMSGVYNNVSLNSKNVAMAELADGITTFYLDVNPLFVDESGYLKADLTFDGFHLYAKGYQEWAAFIAEHGIVR